MFDPLAYPYYRAQTYVDPNPPEVLSDEFYNPTQDALARLFGSLAGYSTSMSYEEFLRQTPPFTVAVNDLIGEEMAVITTGGDDVQSIVPVSNAHGVLDIRGTAAGNRGGLPGLQIQDASRFINTRRWIFRCRLRCSNFTVLTGANPGLVTGLGGFASGLPIWIANDAGFWSYQWDGGSAASAIPTVADEWVTLWIALRDADKQVRWYLKRDADPDPILISTRTLTAGSLADCRRYLRYSVTAGAVAADHIEWDNVSLGVER